MHIMYIKQKYSLMNYIIHVYKHPLSKMYQECSGYSDWTIVPNQAAPHYNLTYLRVTTTSTENFS